MTSQARIVIADDHAMVRDGLRDWIAHEADLTVIGEADTCREVVRLCEFEHPDVLLQDLQMAGSSGFDVIRQLRATNNPVRVLALSGHGKHYARAALDAGAVGFLCKEERRPVVIEALRWAASNSPGTWLSPLAASLTITNQMEVKKYHLTATEQEILPHLKLCNREIASRLFITEGTVKNHISSIYSKLGLQTRQQTIAWAEQHGFLPGTFPGD
jgi:DNA-binding NarL/FixJ family response regulator